MQLTLKCKLGKIEQMLTETNSEANQNEESTLVTSTTTLEPQYLKVKDTEHD